MSQGPADRISVRARLLQAWQQLGMALVLIVLCIVMAVFAPHFSESSNLLNIARQVSINAILAAGMTFVILTGGVDLSVGSALGVTGVMSVYLAIRGVPAPLAVLGAVLIGAIMGWVNGILIARLKLQPFIVTLGALTYLRGFAYVATGAPDSRRFSAHH